MSDDEKYLFDLNGYLVVRSVLTADEVAEANEAVDRHADQGYERPRSMSLSGESRTLQGASGRIDLDGMLGWETPWREPFRRMLTHPRVVPYLHEIVGVGFRMDHNPGLLMMNEGGEGHTLHGSSGPGFDPTQYYIFKDGRMHNGLIVVAWQLADAGPGDGGLCVVPGSHKANLPAPRSLRLYEEHQQVVTQIAAKAGDVVIFTEALTHGTLPWTAKHQRRSLLFRYSPGNMAYDKTYLPSWPAEILDGLDERERGVLEPPYHNRLDRPKLES
jgi:ectoine hydroxylase-related dioxygenase (phytanoyl-CoA dioxygenase family)